mgnify:FL=1
MACAPYLEEAAEMLASSKDVTFGMHSVINAEWDRVVWGPVAPKEKVKSLIDHRGVFYQDVLELAAAKPDLDEIITEYKYQLERLRKVGFPIAYIDSHMMPEGDIPGLAEKINSLGNSNMLVYGMSLILFCLLFAAGMGIAHRHEVAGKTFPENVKARKTAFWLMLFIQIPFWLLCISGETEQLGSVAAKYGWHTQPAVIAAFLFLAELAIFFWACQNVCFRKRR